MTDVYLFSFSERGLSDSLDIALLSEEDRTAQNNVAPDGVETGAPVVGSPDVSQTFVLVPTGIETGAPLLGVPTLQQSFSVAPDGIETGAPVVDSPSLSQGLSVFPDSIETGAPVVGSPILTQATIDNIMEPDVLETGAPVVGIPRVTQGQQAEEILTCVISRQTEIPCMIHADPVLYATITLR